MEIKKGYKMTDVGEIPEDWEVKSIGEIAKTTSGGTPSREDDSLYIGKNRWFTTSELNDGYIYDSIEHISDEAIKITTARIVPANSILMAMYGATIGKLAIITKESSTNQACCAIMVNSDIVMKYVFYNLLFLRQNIIELGVGAGQPNISQSIVRSIHISIPSKKEQQAIADALTKVDNLIMSLSKVIEKKKLIKKGAMQKLLSGEMRLDGFEGEWIKIKLGDISSIKTGSRNVEEHSANGKYPFFVRSKEVMKINTFSYDEEAILVPGEGGIGEIFHYVNGKFDVHQRVYKISDFNDKVNALFIYWYMIIFFGEYAKENTVKATVDSLRLPTFTDFICCLPPTKAEQTAIADILTTMDNEIEALEKERDKYKCIKQGMMQQLLTGKIRLTCQ